MFNQHSHQEKQHGFDDSRVADFADNRTLVVKVRGDLQGLERCSADSKSDCGGTRTEESRQLQDDGRVTHSTSNSQHERIIFTDNFRRPANQLYGSDAIYTEIVSRSVGVSERNATQLLVKATRIPPKYLVGELGSSENREADLQSSSR